MPAIQMTATQIADIQALRNRTPAQIEKDDVKARATMITRPWLPGVKKPRRPRRK